jgi:hypothetical protein
MSALEIKNEKWLFGLFIDNKNNTFVSSQDANNPEDANNRGRST